MLKITGISKTWEAGTANEKKSLNELSLHIKEGEFLTVIGSNGAGKSSLLNAVAGTFLVDSGVISIGGHNVTQLTEHRRAHLLGRVFQDPMMGTAPGMTIEENMALALRRGEKRGLRSGITRKERAMFKEVIAELELGLENRMNAPVGLLSGGQRQALTLLMATLKRPLLLLLDEHTASLDPKTAAKVLELSAKIIANNKLTAMMVTHNMKDAIKHGDRLAMVDDGKIVYEASGEEKSKLTVKDMLDMFTMVSESDTNLPPSADAFKRYSEQG